jgi:membrane complex biogenesis BtpA family protein
MRIDNKFFDKKPIIGMVHLLPLPGSSNYKGNISDIYQTAIDEAIILEKAGINAMIVENFNDEPFLINAPDPVQTAIMAGVVRDIRNSISLPLGVNVQFNSWQSEMAIAYTCDADFIRVEVFVDTVISAMGIIEPCASKLMRYKKMLNADVMIWADIQTKYTSNVIPQPIIQSAKDAENAQADAIIVTGEATGKETPLEDIIRVKEVVSIPILAGSGTTVQNVRDVLNAADGAIVGSALKEDGKAINTVSYERSLAFMRNASNI